MATFWVSAATGDDGDDGSTYALAKATLPAVIALPSAKGDIINVVADGDYVWPTSRTDIPAGTKGTSFVDYGILIRGVDGSAENPALASVVASGGNAIRYWFRVVANSGFVLVRNLEFDGTGKAADPSIFYVSQLRDTGSPDPGPVRFEGCSFLGAATGVVLGGTRYAFDIHSTAPPAGSPNFEIEDCYFQNWDPLADSASTQVKSIIGCVILVDAEAAGPKFYGQILGGGTGGTLTFTNNTIYQSIGNNIFTDPILYQVGAGLDAGIVTVQDNLVFLDSTSGAPAVRFFGDSGPGDGSFTGTVDYNALTGGPNVAVGDLHGEGWYHDLWDTVAHANDQVAYEVAEATIFLTPGSTYAWDALSNGVGITILKDLRPKLYLTDSSTGGAIGALEAGETDLSVTNLSDRNYPRVDETVIFTITASNSGIDDSNVQVTASLPSGLTYISSSAATGSYDSGTGIWTIGDLADAASTILTVTATVDSDQIGNTIEYTATITGDTDDSDDTNNDDTASITVQIPDPGEDDDPTTVPYIDTLPIRAPVMRFDFNMRFQIEKNRKVSEYIRKDVEKHSWREMTTRRVVLATNTTTTINMGGIQVGEFLLVESDVAVQVGIGLAETAKLFPASKAVALVVSEFEIIQIKNPSTTDEASILMVVSD